MRQAEQAIQGHDIKAFGRLMSDSHRSLRDDFAVSCAELDELVEIAERAGAAGARLTGAGLGGCVVALCDERRTDKVLNALARRFYRPRKVKARLADHLFVAEPSEGASVTVL